MKAQLGGLAANSLLLSERESLNDAIEEQQASDQQKHNDFLFDSMRLENAYYDVDNIPTEGIVK